MSTFIVDTPSSWTFDPFENEASRNLFSSHVREISDLRFKIVLTATWEASKNLPDARRGALKYELRRLRESYMDALDDLAMTFGVDNAIRAQSQVERSVRVPPDMLPVADKLEFVNTPQF